MKFEVMTNNRIQQLPMAMFGIVHDVTSNGIRLPFFIHTVESSHAK